MSAFALWFDGPGQVAVRELALAAPGPGEVRVEVLASAISPGTEMLIYRGQFPPGESTDATIAALGGTLGYPLRYGYSCVGRVITLGPGVEAGWQDRRVFAFQPHASAFVAPVAELIAIPDGISDEDALFLPNLETAVNFAHDGAPLLGERIVVLGQGIVVLGQGIVGLLTTAALARLGPELIVTFDRFANRRHASLALGATQSLDPTQGSAGSEGADLVYELSGAPAALDQAIALCGFDGRVVIGSWYGRKRVELDLGGRFHRSRIRLISSQVSTLAPALSGRWSKARRIATAWQLCRAVQPARLITHRYPLDRAAAAYAQVDARPGETLQVAFTRGNWGRAPESSCIRYPSNANSSPNTP